jgi:putative tricarboxylic transport membrane protein
MDHTRDLHKDALSNAVLLVIGGGYLWYDSRYSLDTLANPGPGIFPLVVGLLLVTLAAIQLARSGRRLLLTRPTAKPGSPAACPPEVSGQTHTERIPWLMVGILVLYLMVVSRIGFLTSTFVLVIICSKLMGTSGWKRPVLLAAGLIVACHFLFSVWLKVPLPTGLLI